MRLAYLNTLTPESTKVGLHIPYTECLGMVLSAILADSPAAQLFEDGLDWPFKRPILVVTAPVGI